MLPVSAYSRDPEVTDKKLYYALVSLFLEKSP
jgi:hypothetical protein